MSYNGTSSNKYNPSVSLLRDESVRVALADTIRIRMSDKVA